MFSTTNDALDFALQAIDRGETVEAGRALTWVLKKEPDNTLAWLWMPACLTDERQKRDCYRKLSNLGPCSPAGADGEGL